MAKEIEIVMASASDASTVGRLVFELLQELFPEISTSFDEGNLIEAAKKLLKENKVWALLACDGDDDRVGVLTLNECAAIYAGGAFGEISELYVAPEYRSSRVGELLIDAAAKFGRERGWTNLEVGAPDVPRWQRTVDFYVRCGFKEVGPRLDLNL